MPHRTAVIDLVALTEEQLKDMPRLSAIMQHGAQSRIQPPLPAVTCTCQSTMLTGTMPCQHGVVGNGWHDRESAETRFWKQSNRLVEGTKIWDHLREADPSITIANCFWWYAMYANVDVTVTPRPMYPADGRKIPDIWTRPEPLRESLQSTLGRFPLFKFWGPSADIDSSQWIADCARHVDQTYDPTLLLVYLPHLDYGLQKYGPDDPRMCCERAAIDRVAAGLIDDLERRGRRILLVNEYGMAPVVDAVAPNRHLRQHGLLSIRREENHDILDAGESKAFAVPDHQIAHVYVNDLTRLDEVIALLKELDGVDQVLHGKDLLAAELGHQRSGDLVLVAASDRWFCHDWWFDDEDAPDYQRTVDIHRKPGYDPRELFIDPNIRWPFGAIGWRLMRKRLGFRTLMDVIPLDTSLVRGSHGRPDPALDPLLWCSHTMPLEERIPMPRIADLITSLVLEE